MISINISMPDVFDERVEKIPDVVMPETTNINPLLSFAFRYCAIIVVAIAEPLVYYII